MIEYSTVNMILLQRVSIVSGACLLAVVMSFESKQDVIVNCVVDFVISSLIFPVIMFVLTCLTEQHTSCDLGKKRQWA